MQYLEDEFEAFSNFSELIEMGGSLTPKFLEWKVSYKQDDYYYFSVGAG